MNETFVWSLSQINTSTIWATIYVYVYESNNDISKIISKRWKDQTARQSIYSGSATMSPSLFLHSPSHLLESFLHYVNKLPYGGENLTHQYTHHNFITTYSHLLQYFFSTQLISTTNLITQHFTNNLALLQDETS